MKDGEKQDKSRLNLFISYAQGDEEFVQLLETHMALLQRRGLIQTWHPGRILPGSSRLEETGTRLQEADVILLLVSPDFIASDACWAPEMNGALARNREGTTRVIPILLRPCDWKTAPFGGLAVLPRNGEPVTKWPDRDEAFLDIIQGIRDLPALAPPSSSVTDTSATPSPRPKARKGASGASSSLSDDQQDGERKLKVFLNYIEDDKLQVRHYCDRLHYDGFAPWLDERELLPGQRRRSTIVNALRTSDVVIIFLSHQSVRTAGAGQREIKLALDILDEQPEGALFLIPARLEKCAVPDQLEAQQSVDLFATDGYDRLKKALLARAQDLGL